jgi:bifunctional NMN adenylyltransferase/nudix hydrolase
MYDKKYDLMIYIGRFQPFHNGHRAVLDRAAQLARNVLVLVGSSRASLSPKNPFTTLQRMDMIRMGSRFNANLHIDHIRDFKHSNELWIERTEEVVNKHIKNLKAEKIGIIGFDKDHSSFYLNFFPQWKQEEAPAFPGGGHIFSATEVREYLFGNKQYLLSSLVPEEVHNWITLEYMGSKEYKEIKEDHEYLVEYRKSWQSAPYPPTFFTCDAVVIQSGHVLLIKRGVAPGKGLWAMPGGFIDQNEMSRDAIVRELREETNLRVPEPIIRKSVTYDEWFENPDRSSRGRTITHAFKFELDDSKELPRVSGGDDAAKAKWFSFAEFEEMEPMMFEDHWHIVKSMLGRKYHA